MVITCHVIPVAGLMQVMVFQVVFALMPLESAIIDYLSTEQQDVSYGGTEYIKMVSLVSKADEYVWHAYT